MDVNAFLSHHSEQDSDHYIISDHKCSLCYYGLTVTVAVIHLWAVCQDVSSLWSTIINNILFSDKHEERQTKSALTSCSLPSIFSPVTLSGTWRKRSLRWRDDTLSLLHGHARDWAWHTNVYHLLIPPTSCLPLLSSSSYSSSSFFQFLFQDAFRFSLCVNITGSYISCSTICVLQNHHREWRAGRLNIWF